MTTFVETLYKQVFTRPTVDAVVETVHYASAGRIAWARAYERRGPTWSDLVLIDRKTLVEKLKEGKRFAAGTRHEFNASEFSLGPKIKLLSTRAGEFIVTEDVQEANGDRLDGVPVI